ncbi:MAG: histidinol-phosphate transaminase, partial [bacterium]
PQDQRYIKLNTNENPYPPSPKALLAIYDSVNSSLRRYPDPNANELKATIAAYYKLKTHQVFVGNGSDEVLAHTFNALLKHEKPLLYPDITYSFYPVYSQLYDIPTKTIPLRDNFTINIDDYLIPNGGIIFPNPNAPTSVALSLTNIESLLKHNTESVVVIDEAYVDFGAESAVNLIDQYPNLLVIQTFSKSRALAGIRVGFALGQAPLIEALERVKNSFNSYPLGISDLAGASAAIKDEAYFQETCAKIIATREKVIEELQIMGFEILPSETNFIFAKPDWINAENLYQQLKKAGILVRYFSYPRINEYLRITIGTDEEMQAFTQKVSEILAEQ